MAKKSKPSKFKVQSTPRSDEEKEAMLPIRSQHPMIDRFLEVHNQRLNGCLTSLRESQQHFFEYLPLLLHANHQSLPGYVPGPLPAAGIAGYHPELSIYKLVSRYVKNYTATNHYIDQYLIEGVFLQCRQQNLKFVSGAEFEVWVCHKPNVNSLQIESLQKKCELIEKWALTLELPTKMLLVDIQEFQAGHPIPGYQDNVSAMLNTLVLDEFYSRAMHLAGRVPRWWLVPSDQESQPQTFYETLFEQQPELESITMDFGQITELATGDLITVAFHTLDQAFSDIYASVFKTAHIMALLHNAVAEPISRVIKKRIEQNNISPVDIDPNFIAYEQVEAGFHHIISTEESKELIQRSFFISISKHVDYHRRNKQAWKKDALDQLSAKWNHPPKQQQGLVTELGQWSIERMRVESSDIGHLLLEGYTLFAEKLSNHPLKAFLNKAVHHGLEDKLHTIFEKEQLTDYRRILQFNINIHPLSIQEKLIISPFKAKNQALFWQISLSDPQNPQLKPQTIYRGERILETIAWAHFNGLITNHSTHAFISGPSHMREIEFNDVLQSIQKKFPHRTYSPTRPNILFLNNEHFLKPADVVHRVIYVNINQNPMEQFSREGMHQLSNQNDSLSYSISETNLVMSMDEIKFNSRQEIIIQHYSGEDSVLTLLKQFLTEVITSPCHEKPKIDVECFSLQRSQAIKQRMEDLFDKAFQKLFEPPYERQGRYIVKIGKKKHILFINNDQIEVRSSDTEKACQKILEAPQRDYSPIYLDDYGETESEKSLMLQQITPYEINVFYRKSKRTEATLMISDEWGSLIEWNIPLFNDATVVNPLFRFLRFIEEKQKHCLEVYKLMTSEKNRTGIASDKQRAINVYELRPAEGKSPNRLIQCRIDLEGKSEQFYNFQVMIESTSDHKPSITLYCNYQPFRQSEYGDFIYKKAIEYIFKQHQPERIFPCLITDLEISHEFRSEHNHLPFQTIIYLHYKQQVETALNKTLAFYHSIR